MKAPLVFCIGLAALLGSGCSSTKSAPAAGPGVEVKYQGMDPAVQYSVEPVGFVEARLPDGRLQVGCQLRNKERRRIQVQVQCVFKDGQGFSTGDETPWENLILTENATETVRFTSMNNQAASYLVRVRQAR